MGYYPGLVNTIAPSRNWTDGFGWSEKAHVLRHKLIRLGTRIKDANPQLAFSRSRT